VRDWFNLVAGAAAVVLAGCSAGPAPGSTPSPSATSSGAAVSPGVAGSTVPGAARCPVTRPGRFVPPSGVSSNALFGASSSYGNGQLWVGGLPEGGVIVAGSDFVEPGVLIDRKFGWYRITPGLLTITGRRLDAPAPPARAHVPSGYGNTGFQSSAVSFPTEGCWEITGTVDSTTLTFVTFVIKG
jgi:hypothetical protein